MRIEEADQAVADVSIYNELIKQDCLQHVAFELTTDQFPYFCHAERSHGQWRNRRCGVYAMYYAKR